MKYVILTDELGGRHPVLFHNHLIHSVVAHGICRAYRSERPAQFWQVESAGFYDPETNTCSGRSESLDLDSLPEDAAYISIGGSISYIPRTMVSAITKGIK